MHRGIGPHGSNFPFLNGMQQFCLHTQRHLPYLIQKNGTSPVLPPAGRGETEPHR